MRIAISPRLAIRTFSNMAREYCGSCDREAAGRLQAPHRALI
jgi:hypothetical protein